jgi:hypothetical protein
MSFVAQETRGNVQRLALRRNLKTFMRHHAGHPGWQTAFHAAQEDLGDKGVSKATAMAVVPPAQPQHWSSTTNHEQTLWQTSRSSASTENAELRKSVH